MKVALLARAAHPLHAPGGMERAVYLLAKHLRAQGADVTLFTRPGRDLDLFPGRVVTVRYARWPAGAHGRVLDRTLNYPPFAVAVGARVAEEVRAGGFDVVDAQGLMALGYGRERRKHRDLKAPLVMNPQGMEEHKTTGVKAMALARLRRLSREAASLADVVIATDEATKHEVPKHLGVPARRVRVIPNGVDLEEIARLTPRDTLSSAFDVVPWASRRRFVFISVGRIEAYKGFVDTAEALRRAAPAFNDTWGWIVVGDGPLKHDLRAQCRDLGENVLFAGRVSDEALHALYAGADVFVHPTRFEGSSLVTLEAMAHGLPIVASRAGGIPDKVEHGRNGFLVEPGDVEALAQSLVRIAGDATLRKAMGAASRARVEAFAWPRVAERVLALYDELLKARA
jgi:glycosyltransferase involved in cell wall biosynthesis